MKEAFVGFDSAWSGNNIGALSFAVIQERELVKEGLPRVADWDEAVRIIKKLRDEFDNVLIAIDQPIVVPNQSGVRPVDSVAKSFMGKMGSAAQQANRSKPKKNAEMFGDEAPIWKFGARIGIAGFTGNETDSKDARDFVNFEAAKRPDSGTRLIEVYPALALPALEPEFMNPRHTALSRHGSKLLRYAARYDPSRKGKFSLKDWHRVCKTVKRYAAQFDLQDLSKWASEIAEPWDSHREPKKRHQDKIDAALCLIVALQWRRQCDGVSVIGDSDKGYIVTPTSCETREIFQAACKKHDVKFVKARGC